MKSINNYLSFIQNLTVEEKISNRLPEPEDEILVVTQTKYIEVNQLGLTDFKTEIDKLTEQALKESTDLNTDQLLECICNLVEIKAKSFSDGNYISKTTLIEKAFTDMTEILNNGSVDNVEQIDKTDNLSSYSSLIEKSLNHLIAKFKDELLVNNHSKLKQEKMNWNVGNRQLASLLTALNEKGWVELPLHNSEPSKTKFARLCASIFTWDGTERSLADAYGDREILDDKIDFLKIPKPEKLEGL